MDVTNLKVMKIYPLTKEQQEKYVELRKRVEDAKLAFVKARDKMASEMNDDAKHPMLIQYGQFWLQLDSEGENIVMFGTGAGGIMGADYSGKYGEQL